MDVLHKVLGEAEAGGQHLQVGFLGGMVRIDGEQRRRVNLRRHFRPSCRLHDAVEVERRAQHVHHIGFGFRIERRRIEPREDLLLLGLVDVAVRLGGGDHGGDEEPRPLVRFSALRHEG